MTSEDVRAARAAFLFLIEREIAKCQRHITEGTSVGGETAEWYEAVISGLRTALAIIEASEAPTPEPEQGPSSFQHLGGGVYRVGGVTRDAMTGRYKTQLLPTEEEA